MATKLIYEYLMNEPNLFYLPVKSYFCSVVSYPYFVGCLFHFKVIQGAEKSQAGYEPADNSKDSPQGSK